MKKEQKRLLGCIRRADSDFNLIQDNDRIAVGVSGGKDSLVLLYCLTLYKLFSKKAFSVTAITVDMGLHPFDLSGIKAFCDAMNIPYEIIPTNIGKIVFEGKNESNPCALCANMRRGALNTAAIQLHCNKVALGHHAIDAEETFLMSLLFEGRLNCFSPRTYLSRSDLTVIRPFIYAQEDDIVTVANGLQLPVVKSPCPACGNTNREKMKQLLSALEEIAPDAKSQIIGALTRTESYNLWDKAKQ